MKIIAGLGISVLVIVVILSGFASGVQERYSTDFSDGQIPSWMVVTGSAGIENGKLKVHSFNQTYWDSGGSFNSTKVIPVWDDNWTVTVNTEVDTRLNYHLDNIYNDIEFKVDIGNYQELRYIYYGSGDNVPSRDEVRVYWGLDNGGNSEELYANTPSALIKDLNVTISYGKPHLAIYVAIEYVGGNNTSVVWESPDGDIINMTQQYVEGWWVDEVNQMGIGSGTTYYQDFIYNVTYAEIENEFMSVHTGGSTGHNGNNNGTGTPPMGGIITVPMPTWLIALIVGSGIAIVVAVVLIIRGR